MRVATILLACAAVVSAAQTNAPPSSFEVASVKPTPLSDQANPGKVEGGFRPGQYIWTHASLRRLIWLAYDVQLYQRDLVAGLPPERYMYDVAAKAPAGTTRESFLVMLQNLLAERFGVAVHWVEKEIPSYDLVAAKGGPKLKEAEKRPAAAPPVDPSQPFNWLAGGWPVLPPGIPSIGLYASRGTQMVHLGARMQTVPDLLRTLQTVMDRPLRDKTGLTGTYDFTLDFLAPGNVAYTPPPPDPSEGASEPAPDVFAALERQLGLKLVAGRDQEKLLVVDKFNLTPTEN
jgi:uncharacterized protein (TIGR03435 family)